MKSKTVFVCRECGNETPRWQGQCPACGAWNSIVEFEDKKAPARQNAVRGVARSAPKKLRDVTVGNISLRNMKACLIRTMCLKTILSLGSRPRLTPRKVRQWMVHFIISVL